MSYNTDVAIDDLFATVYQLGMGTPPKGPTILHLAYTAGLAIGIVIFFNHAGKIKLTDDPTPFEVQMRLYERDVNDMNAEDRSHQDDAFHAADSRSVGEGTWNGTFRGSRTSDV